MEGWVWPKLKEVEGLKPFGCDGCDCVEPKEKLVDGAALLAKLPLVPFCIAGLAGGPPKEKPLDAGCCPKVGAGVEPGAVKLKPLAVGGGWKDALCAKGAFTAGDAARLVLRLPAAPRGLIAWILCRRSVSLQM